jgi:hypothetical protein
MAVLKLLCKNILLHWWKFHFARPYLIEKIDPNTYRLEVLILKDIALVFGGAYVERNVGV